MSEDIIGGTIADVAREAGVSRSTVSRAMRGDPSVIPVTRDRVLAAARRVGYQPNAIARLFRSGDRRTVTLVLTPAHLSCDHYAEAISALSHTVAKAQMSLTVSVAADPHGAVMAVKEQLGWSALLAVPSVLAADKSGLWSGEAVIVLLDCLPSEQAVTDRFSTVAFDQAQGIALAVEHLASMGHRNIGFFGGTQGDPAYDFREQGFRAAMQAACLPVRPEWVLHCDSTRPAQAAGEAFDQARNLARARLTAAVCASDEIALGVVDAVRSLRGEVPDDLSVTGYRGSAAPLMRSAMLTTVAHPGESVGRILAELASQRADTCRSFLLAPILHVRDSTAPRSGHPRQTTSLLAASAGVPQQLTQTQRSRLVLDDGMYELRAIHSGMALDVSNRAKTPGGTLCQRVVNGSPTQLWHVRHAGENWYTLRNAGTLLFLDADYRMPNANVVIQNPRNEDVSDIQLWKFEPVDQDRRVFRVINKAKELLLDVTEKSNNPSTLVLVFPRVDGPENENQQWNIRSIPLVTGVYELVAWHSSKALDLPPASAHPGVVPYQNNRVRNLSQRWRVVHQGGGLYRISNLSANLSLQVQRPSKVELAQPDDDPGGPQMWRIDLVDSSELTYRFVNEATGLVLEIPRSQQAIGAAAGAGRWSTQLHQEWLIYADEGPFSNDRQRGD